MRYKTVFNKNDFQNSDEDQTRRSNTGIFDRENIMGGVLERWWVEVGVREQNEFFSRLCLEL